MTTSRTPCKIIPLGFPGIPIGEDVELIDYIKLMDHPAGKILRRTNIMKIFPK